MRDTKALQERTLDLLPSSSVVLSFLLVFGRPAGSRLPPAAALEIFITQHHYLTLKNSDLFK